MQYLLFNYPNIGRVSLGLQLLFSTGKYNIYPVKGTFIASPKAVRCIGDSVTVVGYSPKEMGGFITNDKEFVNTLHQDEKAHEYSVVGSYKDNFFSQLLQLLVAKYGFSSNPYTLELTAQGCTIEFSQGIESDEIGCVIKSPSGDACSRGLQDCLKLAVSCTHLKSFSYKIDNGACERNVSVKRGKLEICKEIAHYLNRVLVFTAVNSDGSITDITCVSHLGCLSRVKDRNGKFHFIAKAQGQLRICTSSFVHALDIPINSISGNQSIEEIFKGV